jgi:GNAT superfamily N-acetyltransferase
MRALRRPNSVSVGADVRIRPARPDEGERLREIARASKGHWGYDPEEVREWADGGDFSPESLSHKHAFVAEAGDEVVAWAGVIAEREIVWLDDMWVDPPWIGQGVGALLFDHAVALARQFGGRTLEWYAEPHAIGFYEKVGGRYLRDGPPSEWGRVLPVMGVDL